MPLRIAKCDWPTNSRSITIAVHGDTREELDSPAARQFAIDHANKIGFAVRGASNIPNIYPVDEKGETPPGLVTGTVKPSAWESEFQFSSGL